MEKRIGPQYKFGPFFLDVAERRLCRGPQIIRLSPKSFDLLVILVENSGHLLRKEELMAKVWPDAVVEENNLAQNISTLRKTLGQASDQQFIETIPTAGYRFVAPVHKKYPESEQVVLRFRERLRAEVNFEQDSEGEDSWGESHETASDPPNAGGVIIPASEQSAQHEEKRSRWKLAGLPVMAAAVSLIVLLMTSFGLFFDGATPFQVRPEKIRLTRIAQDGNFVTAALSPDGRYAVYAAVDESGRTGLFATQLATLSSTEIIAPVNVQYKNLKVSRDGDYVYYVQVYGDEPSGTLRRVPFLGGPSEQLIEDVKPGISFSPDGSKVVFRRWAAARRQSLLMISGLSGCDAREIGAMDYPSEFGEPEWSPDGRVVICAAGHADGGSNKYLIEANLEDGEVRRISSDNWRWLGPLEWLPDGRGLLLIGSRQAGETFQIWRQPYPEGAPHRITNDTNAYINLSLSPETGKVLAVTTEKVASLWSISITDPASARQITPVSGWYRGAVSWASGDQIVHESWTGSRTSLAVRRLESGHSKGLVAGIENSTETTPVVSPDGRHIAFSSDRTGTRHIWLMDSDGSNPRQLTSGSGEDQPAWAPDGRWLLYADIGSQRTTFWKTPIEGGRPVQLTQAEALRPAASPDGRLFAAYIKGDDHAWRIALFPIEGDSPIKIWSQVRNPWPAIRWTPDGQRLLYVEEIDGVGNIWVQPLDDRPHYRLTGFTTDQIFGFDPSPDGTHVACVRGTWKRSLVLIEPVL